MYMEDGKWVLYFLDSHTPDLSLLINGLMFTAKYTYWTHDFATRSFPSAHALVAYLNESIEGPTKRCVVHEEQLSFYVHLLYHYNIGHALWDNM